MKKPLRLRGKYVKDIKGGYGEVEIELSDTDSKVIRACLEYCKKHIGLDYVGVSEQDIDRLLGDSEPKVYAEICGKKYDCKWTKNFDKPSEPKEKIELLKELSIKDFYSYSKSDREMVLMGQIYILIDAVNKLSQKERE